MKNFLTGLVIAVCVLLPLSSVAQKQRSDDDRRPNQGYGIPHDRWQWRLSTEDQGRFDRYYSRWLDYVPTNDQNNRNNMEDHMRDVMSHYNIPSDVPFDQIASKMNQGYSAHRRPDQEGDNDRGQSGDRDRQWQSRLSAKDQQRFDTYYSRWMQARRPETGTRPPAWKSACRILWRTTLFVRTRNFPRSHRAQPKETGATEEWPGRTGVQMHREDLLSRDLLSEIVLLGFGELIFVSLLLFLMVALKAA